MPKCGLISHENGIILVDQTSIAVLSSDGELSLELNPKPGFWRSNYEYACHELRIHARINAWDSLISNGGF